MHAGDPQRGAGSYGPTFAALMAGTIVAVLLIAALPGDAGSRPANGGTPSHA